VIRYPEAAEETRIIRREIEEGNGISFVTDFAYCSEHVSTAGRPLWQASSGRFCALQNSAEHCIGPHAPEAEWNAIMLELPRARKFLGNMYASKQLSYDHVGIRTWSSVIEIYNPQDRNEMPVILEDDLIDHIIALMKYVFESKHVSDVSDQR
jgi:hypothetical protein